MTEETETMKQMRSMCENLRDELTALAHGATVCPNCGRVYEDGRERCPDCECETQDLYGYVHENYGADITVDAYDRAWVKSVCVTFATGGPGIYVDTGDEEVQGRWWGESVDVPLDKDVCARIEECFEGGF